VVCFLHDEFDRGLSYLCCTTICTGSTLKRISTSNWTLLCIATRRRKLRGTWSPVAHQFRKSPAVDNYAQPVDNTLLCPVTGWTRSDVFRPFRSPVLLRGTLYWIVSMIQHRVLTSLCTWLSIMVVFISFVIMSVIGGATPKFWWAKSMAHAVN